MWQLLLAYFAGWLMKNLLGFRLSETVFHRYNARFFWVRIFRLPENLFIYFKE
ncbi:hypothetical protein ACKLNO_08500 [Neisseriaceae bacterium B1]